MQPSGATLMKSKPAQPQPAPGSARRNKKHPAAPAANTALNAQSRRVLVQHYRAKYGVK